jgi:hypothetical protein
MTGSLLLWTGRNGILVRGFGGIDSPNIKHPTGYPLIMAAIHRR